MKRSYGSGLVLLLLLACVHRPTLINNVDDPSKVDLRSNGIVAYELFEPEDMKTELWLAHVETGDRYRFNQRIKTGTSWGVNIGPWNAYQKVTPNGETNRTVYLYELPPGTYDIRGLMITRTGSSNDAGVTPKIRAGKFTIVSGQITYIGSTTLSGTWGTLGLGFNPQIDMIHGDRFSEVTSIVKGSGRNEVKDMPMVKMLVPISVASQ